MDWEAIGAVGESLGAVAVLVTLVYLSVQVRHARTQAKRALSQSRGDALRNLIEIELDDRVNRIAVKADDSLGAESLAPFVQALTSQTALTEEEARVLLWSQVAWWNYFLQIIPNAGELAEMERLQFDVPLGLYGRKGVRQLFYETYIKKVGHPDAVRYIEEVLARSELTSGR